MRGMEHIADSIIKHRAIIIHLLLSSVGRRSVGHDGAACAMMMPKKERMLLFIGHDDGDQQAVGLGVSFAPTEGENGSDSMLTERGGNRR